MKKSEFVTTVAERSGVSKKQILETLESMLEVIKEEVEAGNEVQLYNFGTFGRSLRSERKGFNPNNREQITIPAHYLPIFKAGEGFRQQIKNLPIPA